jgi:undecaprenyl pyrophosphate phosphatase UppP
MRFFGVFGLILSHWQKTRSAHLSAKPRERTSRGFILKIRCSRRACALVVGYFLNDWISSYARNASLVAFDLAVGATVLWYADSRAKIAPDASILTAEISWRQVAVGCIFAATGVIAGYKSFRYHHYRRTFIGDAACTSSKDSRFL